MGGWRRAAAALGLIALLLTGATGRETATAGTTWPPPAMAALAAGPPAAGQSDATLDFDDRPSRGRTILLSGLVPGLGQLQYGNRGAGVGFMLAEVAAWTSLITFRVQGNLRQDRYVEYAERFAGIADASSESNEYYRALARYDRSDPGPGSYNEIEVRLVAKRELFPNDTAAQDRYIEENSITGARSWNWESEARRREFADIRSSSESSFHRADFAVGGLIGARLLSIMHAIWMTAERDGDTPDEQARATDATRSWASRLTPFVDADFQNGENRLGIRGTF